MRQGSNVWIGLIWLKIGTVTGLYEHGNVLSGSIEGSTEFAQLSNYLCSQE
jgi:hypothetical protein